MCLIYAFKFIGTPYKWGGEAIGEGIDCSGLVRRLLMGTLHGWYQRDMTAQMMHTNLKNPTFYVQDLSKIKTGCLIFYGKNLKEITHVSMAIGTNHIIEAGGGGSRTRTKEDAIAHQAFVRLRPNTHRKTEIVAILDPFAK